MLSDQSLKIKKKWKKKKNKKTEDSRCIYQTELDKACFQHYIAYGDFKDLSRRAVANKVLRDKAFDIAKNPKYHESQCGLSVVYNCFDKKLLVK